MHTITEWTFDLHDHFLLFVQGIGLDLCQSSGNNERLNEADEAIDSLPLLSILSLSLERSLSKNVITASPLFTLYSRKMTSLVENCCLQCV